jgi:hypothetical protein
MPEFEIRPGNVLVWNGDILPTADLHPRMLEDEEDDNPGGDTQSPVEATLLDREAAKRRAFEAARAGRIDGMRAMGISEHVIGLVIGKPLGCDRTNTET